MENQFDLVVLGGGPGGYVAAIRAAQLGLSTACVDDNPRFGGTCLRVGCIPSKALLESSQLYHEARHNLAAHGVVVGEARLDMAAMHARKNNVVQTLTQGIDHLLKKNKVARHVGRGKLTAPGVVRVVGAETTELRAKYVVIATGSRPALMKGVECDGKLIGDSTLALNFERPPETLVVIGGGYIGLELGSVWRRLGSRVVVLEGLERILTGVDAEIARLAHHVFEKQGIEIRPRAWVESARVVGSRCVVQCKDAAPIECDRVLLAVGRAPNTADIGLESVGAQVDARGFIRVDEAYATTATHVYAIGDCIGGPMLAHKASEEGVACVERLVTGHGKVHYDVIPAVVYTHPEIASVGKTEEQLQEAGVPYRKGLCPFGANARARTLGDFEGRVKILAGEKSDRVLGVHIIGPRAGDLIAEAAVAMQFGASSEDIARCCHAHPTLAEAVHEAALAVDKRSLHT